MKKSTLTIVLAVFTNLLYSQTFEWAKSMGGADLDVGLSIDVDVSRNVYTTGYFKGTVDFDPGAGIANLTSIGSYDFFISKLDASGNFVWGKSLGGVNSDIGYSIVVDASGKVCTTGYYEGTVDFDPGLGTANLTSAGNFDIFVHKMSQSSTGLPGITTNTNYSIYPNPSNGIFTINFGNSNGIYNYAVSTVEGKLITQGNTSQSQINIDLSEKKVFIFLIFTVILLIVFLNF